MAPSSSVPGGDPSSPISVLFVGESEWRESLLPTGDGGDVLVTTATRGRDGYRWLTTQPGRIDCIVCQHELPDMTGVSLLEAVRAAYPDVPFVLVAGDGSEALASRAITAGVTDYVALDGRPDDDAEADLGRTIRTAVAEYREVDSRRRRSRQFDALFEDPQTLMWVLDRDGTLDRANGAALDLLDPTERPVGQEGEAEDEEEDAFWTLPWWRSEETRARVREGVNDALDGDVVQFETALAAEDVTTVHLSMRRVTDEVGTTESVIVEGVDVSERTELERELRESEELHRVTLNNMTDTVLVTNDAGEFTYICPNVHFIFGYTVEEIRDLGTIDALLGEDLFDYAELEAEGVLTNVECTATDKAGREHTLLVNVREVSIQGGTVLYSCRDVTKRKERERALTALHQTSRGLLYTETEAEIAKLVTDDATDILDVAGTAVYRFDSTENVLRPAAVTDGFRAMHGPLPTVRPQEPGVVSDAFVEQAVATFDDIRDADRLQNPSTEVRGAMVIPLGDHGVFVAATDAVDPFDDVTGEIADLVAATAEAALDRVERESRLRERDRELQEQNRQLSRLNRTNAIIREIDQALVQAGSREEIEHAVCERLTESGRFAFAWVGDADGERLRPRTWTGSDSGYLDEVALDLDVGGTEPALRTVQSGDPTVVTNVGEDLQGRPWRKAALSRGYQSVASVPLAHDEYDYGTLTVYANQPQSFDDVTRSVLYELGETVASAIRSAERKDALLSDTVTELEYTIPDPSFAPYALASAAGCSLELKGGVQQGAENVRMLVSVEDAPADAVVEAASDVVAVEAVRPIVSTDDGTLVQLTVASPFLAGDLADLGAAMRTLESSPTEARVTVDVPRSVDVGDVDERLTSRHPAATLVAQRERDRSVTTGPQFRSEVLESVTDRQLEVVQTAFYSGYFASPRESSGQEVAETVDISSSAFYDHVRSVQQKLFGVLFDDGAQPFADWG